MVFLLFCEVSSVLEGTLQTKRQHFFSLMHKAFTDLLFMIVNNDIFSSLNEPNIIESHRVNIRSLYFEFPNIKLSDRVDIKRYLVGNLAWGIFRRRIQAGKTKKVRVSDFVEQQSGVATLSDISVWVH